MTDLKFPGEPSSLFDFNDDKNLQDRVSQTSVTRFIETKQIPNQVRLDELSVYNWGSFHGLHTAKIDKEGTLITGDNGAGKSTLIDGLMALLLPAGRATFNVAAAQGDKSDRSLLSYMRGSFGTEHDGGTTRIKSKREKGVVTGLRAMYTCDDGLQLTLLALFWTTSASNSLSEVKRIYCVARRNVELTEVLNLFDDSNIRQLKQFLRSDDAITDCDNNFNEYQTLYRKVLHMENQNAPALLSRALGLKKIDDLTKLIRELVLEPSSVRQDAIKVVEEFADLVATHEKLTDAREQTEHLARLPIFAATIQETDKQLTLLQEEKEGVSVYFAKTLMQLWQNKLSALEEELNILARELQNLDTQEKDANALIESRHEAYLNLGGGKIEALKRELDFTQDKLNQVVKTASLYQKLCATLEIEPSLEQAIFDDNLKLLTDKKIQLEKELNAQDEVFLDMRSHIKHLDDAIKQLTKDIEEVSARPDSNIDLRYQKMRDEISDHLSINVDTLPFVGELIDIKDEERPWQGAIERALGGVKTTLLVSQEVYSLVTKWLNRHHTGLHVRLQVVRLDGLANQTEFLRDGFLTKMTFKSHNYREWLKQFLVKFDLHCVDSVEVLDITPHSMTIEGLVHHEKGRYEKKDQRNINDKRAWGLGFSNKSILNSLINEKNIKQTELTVLEKKAKEEKEHLDNLTSRVQSCRSLLEFKWEEINAPYWHDKLNSLQSDIKILESSKGGISEAKARFEEAKEQLQMILIQKSEHLKKQGALDSSKKQAIIALDEFKALALIDIPSEIYSRLQSRIGEITLSDRQKQADISRKVDEELDKVRNKKNQSQMSANDIMAKFRGKEKWQHLTVEWGIGIEGLSDYLDHYEQLKSEGLPNLVEQFKERLNKHATQSLARVKTKLESEREEILERIDIINEVLQKTEFKQGSYLRLGTKREKYPHVIEFDKKIRLVLSQVTSDDHDKRYQMLKHVIEILDKASQNSTAHTLESLRLLDPRHQMSFYAEEVDKETQQIRDVLESSSGKSGGEKESFAGTIVAASLAYVLTPSNYDRPVYSTVFLDEAFSNTAETVSRRVLRVFKALNIHVNLITPFKNLNLARESARSLLIAERCPINHESRLCEVTWQEMDEKLAAKREAELLEEAKKLGISI
ncbi:ATP-binding protein [Thorsellia kenyensis]|uniref:ATP-binding protein n=1 Tax=Thorsellia kenyensis TaxID=1549888 RepID=A0ABV6C8G0_9GAMM